MARRRARAASFRLRGFFYRCSWLTIVGGLPGRIVVHSPWWNPSALTVFAGGKAPERIEAPFEGNGFNYEAAEVGRCVRAGALESPVMPLDESLAILRTMDAFRAQIGLKYPME